MVEPSYRLVCTYCDASRPAESSEMARLSIDVHVSMFYSPAREPGVRERRRARRAGPRP